MNNLPRAFAIFSFLYVITFSTFAEVDVEYLRSETFRERNLPLSDAVRVGNILFVSGNLGIDFSTENLELVSGGIVEETKQALRNIENTLMTNGSRLSNVVKCTIFLANMDEWSELNKVWPLFFTENYPARTAVQAGRLWNGAAIEIECVAVVDN